MLCALGRHEPDRVPALLYGELLGYTPVIAKMLECHCGGLAPREYFGFGLTTFEIDPSSRPIDASRYIPLDEDTNVDEWGVGWHGGNSLHYAEILHPLANRGRSEIEDYPYPDLDQDYRHGNTAERISAIHRDERAAAYFAGSIFETAWYMRGMEQLMLDIMTDRATADVLLDRVTEIVAGTAARLAAADLDLLVLGDDIAMQSGMMMSLEMWGETFKPRLERVIRAAREAKPDILVFYHSDGNVWDAIPGLIEAILKHTPPEGQSR